MERESCTEPGESRHYVTLGAELRRYNDNNLNPGLSSGSYTFSSAWTQANPQRADSTSGDAFASFLLGYPASGFVDRNIDTAYSARYYALYAQDDFKLSSRIMLNLGLRWDYVYESAAPGARTTAWCAVSLFLIR